MHMQKMQHKKILSYIRILKFPKGNLWVFFYGDSSKKFLKSVMMDC